jgi:Pyruvate/2-oxoacid:ferredoxin oxidoreductase delta subunit
LLLFEVLKGEKTMVYVPISCRDTLYNKTGSWRSLTLKFKRKTSPCSQGCPLNQNIPQILELIKENKIKDAYYLLIEKNPFPAICGRACYHFCEEKCNRKEYDEPVAFGKIEKFLGDEALKNNWLPNFPKSNGKEMKILIVGTGPAGLSAAYFLRKNGFRAEMIEKERLTGGLMRHSIPDFRLPWEIVDLEIKKITETAKIEISESVAFNKEFLEKVIKKNLYQAIILAIGGQPRKLNIPGGEFAIKAIEFLKKIKLNYSEAKKIIFQKIIIIGGGNTAMDAARICRELRPMSKIEIITPEAYEEMPVSKEERRIVEKMGIEITPSLSPLWIVKKKNSPNYNLMFRKNNGLCFRKENIDLVISAIGEEAFEQKNLLRGFSPRHLKKIFITGDALGPSSIAKAIASAGKSVEEVINYLEIGKRITLRSSEKEVEEKNNINFAYFKKLPRSDNVIEEAERCFACDICNCEDCQLPIFCPDMAFVKNKNECEINNDYCKGCLICAQECKKGMFKEE